MEDHKFDNAVLQEIYTSLVEIDVDATPQLVEKAIAAKINPLEILNALTSGINTVGDKFEALECFLPELITAAGAMEESMTMLRPCLDQLNLAGGNPGTVVIATLQGDIHDIGRNIATVMLRASGFTVYDLGHDVKPEVIIRKAQELNADVIGLSSLLTTSLPFSKDLMKLLDEQGLREKYRVVMGGGAVTPDYVERIGADGFAGDAAHGVRMIRDLLSER
ncbi:MAG TPA: cobalamin-dependent protein [Anaerolineaceae bacterium]|jgi:trimethylamine corrinoid protein|nr:cobalamin-dependent protein [Anaerolineaceae bacterium]